MCVCVCIEIVVSKQNDHKKIVVVCCLEIVVSRVCEEKVPIF